MKDSARKRTFNPEEDVAELLEWWTLKNPNVIFSRMVNDALRSHLMEYRRKRRPAINGNGKAVAA